MIGRAGTQPNVPQTERAHTKTGDRRCAFDGLKGQADVG